MSTDSPEIKASSGEAWKAQMRAENAELERQADSQTGSTPDEASTKTIPPADFSALVEMLTTQALIALGMLQPPGSDKNEPQLALGRHFIDLLGVIEAKSAGNLSGEETSLLGGSLHYLRMSYIEISKRTGNQKN